ncbi:hypothetical protein LMG23992_04120 [Cupriavidus laharis]|uniref:DUF4231 domain-containing protein n=2 Tax=Cupriavidus laharis TaxID=151654 RepID=A0ABN7Z3Y6_9BURK|nr:hypothetical protein LMG23992_04120 [Cupriavidus laharis]
MNDICSKQVEPRMLKFLHARTLIYRRAKTYQAIGLIVSLGLPLAALLASAFCEGAKPYVALFALTFSYLEVVCFDSWLRIQLKTAAKLQEEFDCTVLQMNWNSFLVGAHLDPEQIFEDDFPQLGSRDEQRLRNWYPSAVAGLPVHLARLVCQRTNIWYDNTLRKRYRRLLLAGATVLIVVVGSISLWIDRTLTSFVLSTLAPMTPVIIWGLRERNRHAAACELLDRLNEEVKKLFSSSRAGASEQQLSTQSRALQDAIYSHRVSSPLVFDWIYNRLRSRLEQQMNAGAEQFLEELRPAVAKPLDG